MGLFATGAIIMLLDMLWKFVSIDSGMCSEIVFFFTGNCLFFYRKLSFLPEIGFFI